MAPALLLSPLPLLVVVDFSPSGGLDLRRVEAAIEGGATAVQLRGKGASAHALFSGTCELLPLCRARRVPLFVNDRPDVALAAGADGAQVGPDDLPPEDARRVVGSLLLGVSARSLERVQMAERARADLIGAGALRATGTKTDAVVIGLAGIAALVTSTRIPVLGVGGVRPDDAPALRRAGAAGMAVASGILGDPDPARAARAYRSAWDQT